MDGVSENKKKKNQVPTRLRRRREGWNCTIISFSLSLNVFILCYQYADDQNSLFLTKRQLNEGLSISVGWLVNLSVMSVLKALELTTVSLCQFPIMSSRKKLKASSMCFENILYSNRFICWGKCFFSQPPTLKLFIYIPDLTHCW